MMKVYDEALVNSYTADYQYAPAVSQLTGGGYVVTWVSRGQDGNADGIYAQRFSASGIPAGPEFRVNSNVIGNQVEPTVVGLSDGSFAVVWTDQSGLDGSSYGVYMQRYSADGLALGTQQRVNSFTTNDQGQASVAAYNGGYVVTWYSNGQDGSGYGVYAQRYDNAGNPMLTNGVNEFRVNATTAGSQYEPDVAALADGRFVVVWRSDSQDGSSAGVYAQRYNADGTLAGGEFRVNSTTANGQYEAKVTMLGGGGFVVV
ncbi:MAG: flagellar hook associated protein, partial [Proteobacteria bacterium]|nr:flagellar hook associated protein [Pseudomonadota bacterium]